MRCILRGEERQQEELNMGKTKTKLTYLIELALLVGILLMMNITGLAMIPLPGQYASIMTVPVAVGAMMLGPLAGGVLGGVMGCISFYTAIKTGFSTLFLAGYTGGTVVLLSFVNTIIPRILMGICVGWIFRAVHKIDRSKTISYYIGGLAAPVLNTVFFMGFLVLIFYNCEYVQNLAGTLGAQNAFMFIVLLVGVQGVVEAIVCSVTGTAIGSALLKVTGRMAATR